MPRAQQACATPGCPEVVAKGRCTECRRKAEQRRGTAAQRGYGHDHRETFRLGVIARHPFCQYPGCTAPSTDADHYPLSRRELVAADLDPNDPQHGRGLCHSHHSRETSQHQPGGWNQGR